MKFFERKPQKKTYKKREKETLDSALEQSLIRKARTDKDWALRTALSRFNLSDEGPDPIAKQKNEIKAKVYDKVFTKISNNPELADQFESLVMAEIFEQVGIQPDELEEGGRYEEGNEITRTLRSIRSLKQLQTEIAGESGESNGGGFLKSLFDSEFGRALGLALVGKMGGGGGVPQEPVYIIKVDGQVTKVTESDYRNLLAQGKVAPVAELSSPKHPTEPPLVSEPPELPEYFKTLNFEALAAYMDQDPKEFVEQLKDNGDDESDFLWGFLKTTSPEEIKNFVTPYRSNPEVSAVIEKLLSDQGMEWLTAVITCIKEIEEKEE